MAGFNQVRVADKIEFNDNANNQDNIYGNPSTNKIVLVEDFITPAIDATNDWVVSVGGTGDTIAYNSISGGAALMTSGSVDDDVCSIAGALVWRGDRNATIEVRMTPTSAVAGQAWFVGFSDATSEAATNAMPIHYPAGTLTAVADNAAGFIFDADKSATLIYVAGVKATVLSPTTLGTSTGITNAINTAVVLRATLKNDFVTFHVNGVLKASRPIAVTQTTLLCPTIHLMTRANASSQTLSVDYIKVWQDRLSN